jgi:hypothetical protein
LTGQTIFPNWIKTMKEGSTDIWDVGGSAAAPFSAMFFISSTKSGDTGEPKFMDGTVLSSIGQPSFLKYTYTNRTGITPVYPNWQ